MLLENRTLAELVRRGATFSLVRYTRGGIDYEVLVENEDYEFEGEDTNSDNDDQN